MKTISSTYVREHLLTALDGLPPDGVVITIHGRPVAKLVPVDPQDFPKPEAIAPTPQRIADAVLQTLRQSPGVELAWSDVRPAYRLRKGADTQDVLDLLRETPGVVLRPAPTRNGQGWLLRYEDLL